MASDSSDDDLDNWVFYRDREEWRDVTPIEQDDGPFPVVAIAYTDKCKSQLDCKYWNFIHLIMSPSIRTDVVSLNQNLKRSVLIAF